ncbi:MAG: phosphotransferase [Planctomycetes bacterium]|nr:phosphotransferase [Planctomycetota bacterium]MCB9910788.1 phosphotransferase [Planctomycetota bacterium]MCB9912815.1 phosphotransferase [Planctomycetota bacterium]HPF15187.1 phosphotransferase [Planctomycetota bacterium]HRV80505.1 phosphotransferase [Planctomycetota bacterium]
MNQAWRADYRPEHLLQVCSLWDLETEPIPGLFREGECFLFRGRHGRVSVAIRLTHPGHRSLEALDSELRWMQRVGAQGVDVPKTQLSRANRRVEAVQADGKTWHASVLEWVAGEGIRPGHPLWTPDRLEHWGAQLGRMQRLAREEANDPARYPRHRWNDPEHLHIGPDFWRRFPADQDAAQALVHAIEALGENDATFGLAHGDLFGENVLATEDSFYCIDFDDLCYRHFVYDLIIPAYCALVFETSPLEAAAEAFALPFFRGYRREGPLEPANLDHVGLFLRLRDMELKSLLDLWAMPPENAWVAMTHRHVDQGNPLCELPWRDWFEAAR